jgi:hypothetical protein
MRYVAVMDHESDCNSRIRSWGDMSLPPQGQECSTDATACISQIVQAPVSAESASLVPTMFVMFWAVMVIAASTVLQ